MYNVYGNILRTLFSFVLSKRLELKTWLRTKIRHEFSADSGVVTVGNRMFQYGPRA